MESVAARLVFLRRDDPLFALAQVYFGGKPFKRRGERELQLSQLDLTLFFFQL
jgi:hypothetical protein